MSDTSPGLVDAATARVAEALRKVADDLAKQANLRRMDDIKFELMHGMALVFRLVAEELEASGTPQEKETNG